MPCEAPVTMTVLGSFGIEELLCTAGILRITAAAFKPLWIRDLG